MNETKKYVHILDGQEIDKLDALHKYIQEDPVSALFDMFPNEREISGLLATKMVGSLAFLRSSAIKMRLIGEINSARLYEETFERIYQKLPEFAKW